ncbi:HipA domain-containing protein [Perlucidibaca aquatica]|uniref:HipA domain-containing protein n=1 Tax=Perlucidibaca aquatica TaxID=1852776 RepID=UPI00083B1F87|nr:HipA domain-containing protein [Perlucidibaca aquatica]
MNDGKRGNGGVHRIAQESLYAAAGCLGIEAELNHRQACLKLKAIATDPEETILAYVWRDLLNLALGNRDNHGRNTAVQRLDDGLIQLAPLFDFAPMMMHPDGISRRMTWGQKNGSRPDWRRVAEQLDEAQILPQARLLDRIPEWQNKLSSLPELLRRHDCPAPVMGRIVKPYEDCMQTLTEAR